MSLSRTRLVVAAVAALAAVLAGAPAYADEVRDKQWQLEPLRAEDAWQHARGAGVVVAVLDSGVDADQPDLAGRVLPGYNVVDDNTDTHDTDGHGTAVAALIAGRDDDTGVVGLAPEARILPVRVGSEEMNDTDVAEGIRWAVDHDATVLNLSLGGERYSDEISEAVAYALEHDVVVVAAAGNVDEDGDGIEIGYPARLPGVVAVTGLTQTGKPWHNSSRGPRAALSAPAVGVIVPHEDDYAYASGTSFAAPMVAAAAALIRSKWPAMSSANVVNRLVRTARDLGRDGRDSRYGFGRVDLYRALTVEVPGARENPLLLGSHQAVPASKPPPSAAASPPAAAPSGVAVVPLVALLLALAVLLVAMAVLGVRLRLAGPAGAAPGAPRPAPGPPPPIAAPRPPMPPRAPGAATYPPPANPPAGRRGPTRVAYLTPVREPYSGVPRTAGVD